MCFSGPGTAQGCSGGSEGLQQPLPCPGRVQHGPSCRVQGTAAAEGTCPDLNLKATKRRSGRNQPLLQRELLTNVRMGKSQTAVGKPWEAQKQRVPEAEPEPDPAPRVLHRGGVSNTPVCSLEFSSPGAPQPFQTPVRSLQVFTAPTPDPTTPLGVHSPGPAQLSRRTWGEASAPRGGLCCSSWHRLIPAARMLLQSS